MNSTGIIAKYLATSLAIEKVVKLPLVINNCFPIRTISINLVGEESKSTIFPASLAAWVPVFIATATAAWAKAGASLVPSPVIATRCPLAWSSRIISNLPSGVASAKKSSTPASAAIAAAVKGLSPVIITVLIPILRRSANFSLTPCLIISLRWITPKTFFFLVTTNGVPPRLAISVTTFSHSSLYICPFSVTYFLIVSAAPLRISLPW